MGRMSIRDRFERRVAESRVAHVLASIAAEPNRRSTAIAGDLVGEFDYWFDGGAAKVETGYITYRFSDHTTAVVGFPVPALSVEIEFSDGCRVRVQQEMWEPEGAGHEAG